MARQSGEIYGVILRESRDGWPGTLNVDVEATEALRSRRRSDVADRDGQVRGSVI
jgi:hypothetical protein